MTSHATAELTPPVNLDASGAQGPNQKRAFPFVPIPIGWLRPGALPGLTGHDRLVLFRLLGCACRKTQWKQRAALAIWFTTSYAQLGKHNTSVRASLARLAKVRLIEIEPNRKPGWRLRICFTAKARACARIPKLKLCDLLTAPEAVAPRNNIREQAEPESQTRTSEAVALHNNVREQRQAKRTDGELLPYTTTPVAPGNSQPVALRNNVREDVPKEALVNNSGGTPPATPPPPDKPSALRKPKAASTEETEATDPVATALTRLLATPSRPASGDLATVLDHLVAQHGFWIPNAARAFASAELRQATKLSGDGLLSAVADFVAEHDSGNGHHATVGDLVAWLENRTREGAKP